MKEHAKLYPFNKEITKHSSSEQKTNEKIGTMSSVYISINLIKKKILENKNNRHLCNRDVPIMQVKYLIEKTSAFFNLNMSSQFQKVSSVSPLFT